ncbi:MAG TPA: hypothetical protein VMF29_00680 [Candidatus Edwardsbacteria bacterium]|nr:hypothetical protein [Candidatus Edwardsbacteria bacterium]
MSTDPWIWLSAILTLFILSFLYRDNPLYRFAEHLFTGLAVGYLVAVYWFDWVKPYGVDGIFGARDWALLIPLAIGTLYLARFVPRLRHLMLVPIAIDLGFSLGNSLPRSFEYGIIKQMQGCLLQPAMLRHPFDPYGGLAVGLLTLAGVVCTISYFYFSREHKGLLRYGGQVGIWFVMVGFGASFGYSVMARVSLLISRVQFLLTDWIHIIK